MSNPRVRPLEPKGWIEYEGRAGLVLRDPLELAATVIVPEPVPQILSLCDGTRDLVEVCAALREHFQINIPADLLQDVLDQLTGALLLESPAADAAFARMVAQYRAEPHRPPALAGLVYPESAAALLVELDAYGQADQAGAVSLGGEVANPSGPVRGLISPHIDYPRGGPLYARTWGPVRDDLRAADLVVIFGTDHWGGPGKITLTRHDFATPYGVLHTDRALVDHLASEFGDEVFEEEIHHRSEHSIELAAVWLHHQLTGREPLILPVLCGSFAHLTKGLAPCTPDDLPERFVEALRTATAGRRVFAVAAADFAHVGPNFGDPQGWGPAERAALTDADRRLTEAICRGSAAEVLAELTATADVTRICGLPPIYLTLRLLGESRGELAGYAHCPADPADQSLVSIAGLWLR